MLLSTKAGLGAVPHTTAQMRFMKGAGLPRKSPSIGLGRKLAQRSPLAEQAQNDSRRVSAAKPPLIDDFCSMIQSIARLVIGSSLFSIAMTPRKVSAKIESPEALWLKYGVKARDRVYISKPIKELR